MLLQRIHLVAGNCLYSSSSSPNSLCWLPVASASTRCTYTQGHTHTHKNKTSSLLLFKTSTTLCISLRSNLASLGSGTFSH